MIRALIDLWRRTVPGEPKITDVRFYERQADLPRSLPRRTLALVGGTEGAPKWAAFECPCGTGHRIMVPLSTSRAPRWTFSCGSTGISLKPSIDHNDGQRCHFWLRDGRVRWAPNRRSGRLGRPRRNIR